MNHFCVVVTLISLAIASPTSNPCENSDKITFPGDPMIRSVEVNGTTVSCYSDGTPVNGSPDIPPNTDRTVELPSRIFVFSDVKRNVTAHLLHKPPRQPTESTAIQIFRTDFNGYPMDLIKDILETQSDKFNMIFSSDAIVNNVSTRFDTNDVEQMCRSIEEVIYPTQGQLQDETSLFIVNTMDRQQGVRITRCIDADSPCMFSDYFPNNFYPVCRQQYVYRELLALRKDNKTLIKEKFRFPACCSCVVVRN